MCVQPTRLFIVGSRTVQKSRSDFVAISRRRKSVCFLRVWRTRVLVLAASRLSKSETASLLCLCRFLLNEIMANRRKRKSVEKLVSEPEVTVAFLHFDFKYYSHNKVDIADKQI